MTIVKTLDGRLTVEGQQVMLTFSGVGAHRSKKRASPVTFALTDLQAVEVQPPRGVRAGSVRFRLHGQPPSHDRPERDPLSVVVDGSRWSEVVGAARHLQAVGVPVEGVPVEAEVQDPPEARPATSAPTVAQVRDLEAENEHIRRRSAVTANRAARLTNLSLDLQTFALTVELLLVLAVVLIVVAVGIALIVAVL